MDHRAHDAGGVERRAGGVAFTEVDVFGVYVAPMSLMMIAAWLATAGLRFVLGHLGLLRLVWHPALFLLGIYTMVLGCITLFLTR
jgi:hypothetical protein